MSNQSDVLDSIFRRLASRNEETRLQAAAELRVQVVAYTSDFAGHDGSKGIWSQLFHKTFELTRSNNGYEKLGATVAIDTMLESTTGDTPDRGVQKALRLYEYLRPLLLSTDSVVISAAAHVVGNMVRIAGANLGESWFNKEVGQALQLLEDPRQEVNRFSGVLVLHQFASNAPALFHPFVSRVLEKIWVPLRDSRDAVRERASMLLSACLDIVKTREKDPWDTYKKIFDEARAGLNRAGSIDTVLGSLLAFGAMLQNQHPCMAEYFGQICEQTLKYRENKEFGVRRSVITLIPNMATYDGDEFEAHYLARSMQYLFQALGKQQDREVGESTFLGRSWSLVDVGSIRCHGPHGHPPPIEHATIRRRAAQDHQGAFADERVSLFSPDQCFLEADKRCRKKNPPLEGPLFQCLAMLTSAVGPMLTREMHEVLDLMFPWGLSVALYQALEVIASHIPPLLRTIQERLLDTLSMILTGQHFRPLGAPMMRGKTTSKEANLLRVGIMRQIPFFKADKYLRQQRAFNLPRH